MRVQYPKYAYAVNYYSPTDFAPVKPGGTIGLHSVSLSVRPSVPPSVRHTGFPYFSPACIGILSCNFAYDFLLLYYRSSSIVVNLRQFLWELCPFRNLEYRK